MSKPNEPAYPTDERVGENYMDAGGYGRCRTVSITRGGMTTRQRFVMAAMQGLLANSSIVAEAYVIAGIAREFADAALAEEERTRGKP